MDHASHVRPVRNVRLTLAYDGTDFRGFAESDGVRTVMGELRRAVGTVIRGPAELTVPAEPMPAFTRGVRWSPGCSPMTPTSVD